MEICEDKILKKLFSSHPVLVISQIAKVAFKCTYIFQASAFQSVKSDKVHIMHTNKSTPKP